MTATAAIAAVVAEDRLWAEPLAYLGESFDHWDDVVHTHLDAHGLDADTGLHGSIVYAAAPDAFEVRNGWIDGLDELDHATSLLAATPAWNAAFDPSGPMTARTAYMLAWNLARLTARYYETSAIVVEDGPVAAWHSFDWSLPVSVMAQGAEWYVRMSKGSADYRDRFITGEVAPQCLAEQVLLRQALNGIDNLDDHEFAYCEQYMTALTPHARDYEFDHLHSALFTDTDDLDVCNPAMDGMENQSGSRSMSLHPTTWWQPFVA